AEVGVQVPRAVVAARCAAGALVRVACEQGAASGASLERKSDRGPERLEASAVLRRLEERTLHLRPVAVQHQQVRREWIGGVEEAAQGTQSRVLRVVAVTGETSAGLDDEG